MKNITFIGTNNFAASILESLIKKKIKITYIITKNDTKIGRGQKIKPYPVKIIAEKYKIKYISQKTINSKKSINLIKKVSPDIILITEYGEKISSDIIQIPKYGIINAHPSILPKMRGPTPIQTALLNGEKETGVSVIKITNKIDSGNILNIMKCKINKNDTYIKLHNKLIKLSVSCLIKTIKELKNNKIKEIKQNENEATYTKKITKNFYKINWNDTAINIERKIKALTGIKYPFSSLKENQIKIIDGTLIKKQVKNDPGTIININTNGMEIATKENIIKVRNIQFQGKKITHIKDVINSKKNLLKIGEKLE